MELNRLADRVFQVVRDEYGVVDPVVVHLDRSDRLMSARLDLPAVVTATLLSAQLLRRATASPAHAHPRCVVGLTDFLDQLIPSLVEIGPPGGAATETLLDLHAQMDGLAMNLALLADPGAPGYSYG